jgi:hypothetical protein
MKNITKACINLLVSGSLPQHSSYGLQKPLAAMTANAASIGVSLWPLIKLHERTDRRTLVCAMAF